MDLVKSKLINVAELKIVTANVWFPIQLQAKDCYGNAASISEKLFKVDVRKVPASISHKQT